MQLNSSCTVCSNDGSVTQTQRFDWVSIDICRASEMQPYEAWQLIPIAASFTQCERLKRDWDLLSSGNERKSVPSAGLEGLFPVTIKGPRQTPIFDLAASRLLQSRPDTNRALLLPKCRRPYLLRS